MAVLNHKLRRELQNNAGVLLTVVAIIAVGTGCFVAMGSAIRILEDSQQEYYRAYRFADFWIDVKKAPLTALQPLRELDGVALVESRIVFDVILDLPGENRPLTGRLISTPADGLDRVLNGLCLVRGTSFSDDRDEEIILSEAFAKVHNLNPGDRIQMILNRKRESFIIVGTAISPEYVYMVRGAGDLVPDPRHFGILYVKQRYARDVLGFRDACNQFVGRVLPGQERHVEMILQRAARTLDPYGVLATTPRARQASHRFLSDEIAGGRISSTVIPAIFLAIAALVLNVLMSRFAERQRAIIGTLKALGYSDRQVLGHFVAFGVAVGIAGGLVGDLLGIWLAAGMIEMYKGFFQFPHFAYRLYPDLLLIGMGISVAFAVAGTAKGVWVVLRLQPAEAMRQKPPERGGAIFLERWPWLWRRLGFRTHIALRSLARNRVRTATAVISTALATSLILIALMLYDSVWFLVDFQFNYTSHSDVQLGLRDDSSDAAVFEVERLPGVDYAEPVLGVACDLRNGRYTRRLAVTGLSRQHRLTTPMRADLKPVTIPQDGLVLGTKLAELLHVRVGETLELIPVRGRRDNRTVHVAAVMDSYLGLDCYADRQYLSSIVGEASALNALQTQVNPAQQQALYAAVKKLPNVQSFSVREDSRASITSTFVGSMSATLAIAIIFAGVIAFGSIVNNALVEIADSARDIATFRVLGYEPLQVAAIFFRQNVITFLLSLALAAPITYGIAGLLSKAYDTELYRMPLMITPFSALVAVLIAFSFVVIAQLVVYRQVRRFDWLEGIKVKE